MKEYIQQLPPDKLVPFQNHPYQVREDAALSELMESIRTHGVLSPLLARPEGERYELVSGHRRRLAAQKLELKTVPVLVREMTDDEAVILMVDSNLQRENLLPSEKAFAYKMKLEAMKHQGKATSSLVGTRLRSDDLLADSVGESRMTIQRYIRWPHRLFTCCGAVLSHQGGTSGVVGLDRTGRRHAVVVASHPHEAAIPRSQADAGGAVRDPHRRKAQPEGASADQNGVSAKVFPAQLLRPADGAGNSQAAGDPLPDEEQGRAVILYTGVIRTGPVK